MSSLQNFSILRKPKRIWIIGAIHNNFQKLRRLHQHIIPRLKAHDKLIYTGNMIGHNPGTNETIKELLTFRRYFLARPPLTSCNDIIYLRGRQEEMLLKLTSLHFAPHPLQALTYSYHAGLSSVLSDYMIDKKTFIETAKSGTTTELIQYTTQLSNIMRTSPGHMPLFNILQHASYSEDGLLLIVSSGLNPKFYLQKQGDEFWWGGQDFNNLTHATGGFCRLIRGYDPLHEGYQEKPFTISLDGGNNFEHIHAVCIDRHGDILEKINF